MVDSDYINIDDIPFLSSREIVDGIKYLMGEGRVEYPSRYVPMVANIIGSIMDMDILCEVVEVMKKLGWFGLLGMFPRLDGYDVISRVKILSSYYRLFLGYEFFSRENARLNDQIDERQFKELGLKSALPSLKIILEGRSIKHNLLLAVHVVQRKTIITEIENANGKSQSKRNLLLSAYISDLEDLNFNQDTAFYQPHIEHLKKAIGRVGNGLTHSVNEHGDVFSNGGFFLFEHILVRYVRPGRGRQADIAYFYWRLFNDKNKFIHQRQEAFKSWFERTYPHEPELGKFRTLDQLHDVHRSNNYLDAVEWFKSTKR